MQFAVAADAPPGDVDGSRRRFATRRATRSCAIRRSRCRPSWTLRVVAADARGQRRNAAAFEDDRVRHGRSRRRAAPPRRRSPRPPSQRAPTPVAARRRRAARRLQRRSARPAAISAPPTSCSSSSNAEAGVKEKGLFEGRGPLAILAARAPRRPGAEPHAVRAADDSDQPRDHRRRRAGRLAQPRLPARRGVRRGDGARLRRARPRSSSSRPARSARSTRRPGSTSASPCCSSCSRWRCSTSSSIDFSRFSSRFSVGDVGPRHVSRRVQRWAPSRRCSPAPASRRSSFRSCCSRAICTRPARRPRWRCRFCSGVGMAIPWPIAGAGIAALPKPGRVDGPRQAGLRRLHSGDGGLLRLPAYGIFANRWVDPARGRVERRGEAEGRLARVARRRPRRGRARAASRC